MRSLSRPNCQPRGFAGASRPGAREVRDEARGARDARATHVVVGGVVDLLDDGELAGGSRCICMTASSPRRRARTRGAAVRVVRRALAPAAAPRRVATPRSERAEHVVAAQHHDATIRDRELRDPLSDLDRRERLATVPARAQHRGAGLADAAIVQPVCETRTCCTSGRTRGERTADRSAGHTLPEPARAAARGLPAVAAVPVRRRRGARCSARRRAAARSSHRGT